MEKTKKINLLGIFNENFKEAIEDSNEKSGTEIRLSKPFYKRMPFWLFIVVMIVIVQWLQYYFTGGVNIYSIIWNLLLFVIFEWVDKIQLLNSKLLRHNHKLMLENILLEHFIKVLDDSLVSVPKASPKKKTK